jgi:hypothetical protein
MLSEFLQLANGVFEVSQKWQSKPFSLSDAKSFARIPLVISNRKAFSIYHFEANQYALPLLHYQLLEDCGALYNGIQQNKWHRSSCMYEKN